MKIILPNLPPPKLVLDLLSENEDGEEDENDDDDEDDDDDDDDDGVEKWHLGWNGLFVHNFFGHFDRSMLIYFGIYIHFYMLEACYLDEQFC